MRLTQVAWQDVMTPEQILTLGTTRSSYIRSSEAGRERMQANLRWYLYEHLGYAPGQDIRHPLHDPRVARGAVERAVERGAGAQVKVISRSVLLSNQRRRPSGSTTSWMSEPTGRS